MTHRLWRPTFVLVEVVLLLAIPVLAYRGFDAVLGTTDGQAVDPELDPTDPGYEAFLEPTPLLLVLGLDEDGALSWSSLLALGGADLGGAIVMVPTSLVVPAEPVFELPQATLVDRYAQIGAEGVRHGAARTLGIGIETAIEIGPDRMAELVGPAAPLALRNLDRVEGFEAGDLTLQASEVVEYLLATDDDESELTRLTRQEAVWEAWLERVAASTDPDVVPGERLTGIGRFVRGLAAGVHTTSTPPVDEAPDPLDPEAGALVADGTVTDFVEELVPFPVAWSPGERLKVRVLDGVGADGLQLAMARDVVRAGGQVVLVGNSDAFDATESRLVFFDGALTERAEVMGAELGIPVEQLDGLNPDDRVDITVVAGRDRLATYGLTARTTNDGGGTPG